MFGTGFVRIDRSGQPRLEFAEITHVALITRPGVPIELP